MQTFKSGLNPLTWKQQYYLNHTYIGKLYQKDVIEKEKIFI